MIIYKIENKINGKIYIGQASKTLRGRIKRHLRAKKSLIGRSLQKYGIESFIISVVDHTETRKELTEKEIHWIKILDCKYPKGYNLTDGGEGLVNPSEEVRKRIGDHFRGSLSPFYGKPGVMKGTHATEETKKKMSQSHQNQTPWNKGIKGTGGGGWNKGLTKETDRRMANIGKMNRHPASEETKVKLKEARKRRPESPNKGKRYPNGYKKKEDLCQ